MLASPTTYVKAIDGTSLAVYERGSKKNPTLVLSNGLGGNFDAWDTLVRHFYLEGCLHFRNMSGLINVHVCFHGQVV